MEIIILTKFRLQSTEHICANCPRSFTCSQSMKETIEIDG